MATERFKTFISRYKTENYGVSSNQSLIDPRLDEGIALVTKPAEAHYIPTALESAEDEAIVMAVLAGSPAPLSAEDPKLRIMTDIDKAQEKIYDLKCYVLTRPMCRHLDINEVATLNPLHLSLLPTFKATITDDESLPAVGDIVMVKYDNLAHTEGKFIKLTGKNVSDMFAENAAAEESLADAFESGAHVAELAGDFTASSMGYTTGATGFEDVEPTVGAASPPSPAGPINAGTPSPQAPLAPQLPSAPARLPDIFDVPVVGYDGYGE